MFKTGNVHFPEKSRLLQTAICMKSSPVCKARWRVVEGGRKVGKETWVLAKISRHCDSPNSMLTLLFHNWLHIHYSSFIHTPLFILWRWTQKGGTSLFLDSPLNCRFSWLLIGPSRHGAVLIEGTYFGYFFNIILCRRHSPVQISIMAHSPWQDYRCDWLLVPYYLRWLLALITCADYFRWLLALITCADYLSDTTRVSAK